MGGESSRSVDLVHPQGYPGVDFRCDGLYRIVGVHQPDAFDDMFAEESVIPGAGGGRPSRTTSDDPNDDRGGDVGGARRRPSDHHHHQEEEEQMMVSPIRNVARRSPAARSAAAPTAKSGVIGEAEDRVQPRHTLATTLDVASSLSCGSQGSCPNSARTVLYASDLVGRPLRDLLGVAFVDMVIASLLAAIPKSTSANALPAFSLLWRKVLLAEANLECVLVGQPLSSAERRRYQVEAGELPASRGCCIAAPVESSGRQGYHHGHRAAAYEEGGHGHRDDDDQPSPAPRPLTHTGPSEAEGDAAGRPRGDWYFRLLLIPLHLAVTEAALCNLKRCPLAEECVVCGSLFSDHVRPPDACGEDGTASLKEGGRAEAGKGKQDVRATARTKGGEFDALALTSDGIRGDAPDGLGSPAGVTWPHYVASMAQRKHFMLHLVGKNTCEWCVRAIAAKRGVSRRRDVAAEAVPRGGAPVKSAAALPTVLMLLAPSDTNDRKLVEKVFSGLGILVVAMPSPKAIATHVSSGRPVLLILTTVLVASTTIADLVKSVNLCWKYRVGSSAHRLRTSVPPSELTPRTPLGTAEHTTQRRHGSDASSSSSTTTAPPGPSGAVAMSRLGFASVPPRGLNIGGHGDPGSAVATSCRDDDDDRPPPVIAYGGPQFSAVAILGGCARYITGPLTAVSVRAAARGYIQ